VVSVTDPYGRILGFLDRSRYFSIKQILSCTHEAEWTPFQTHYFFFGSAGNRIHSYAAKNKTKQNRLWPQSMSELYRLRERRLSEKLVPTLADRRVSRSRRGGSPTAIILAF
jgi:hypothetical protein